MSLEYCGSDDYAICTCCGEITHFTRAEKKKIQLRRKKERQEEKKQEQLALERKRLANKKRNQKRRQKRATDSLIKLFTQTLQKHQSSTQRIKLSEDVKQSIVMNLSLPRSVN